MHRIKRINTIRHLGVYSNYARSGEIRDFNEKNIIYGWNYCGKTTLTRLFNWLNAGILIDEDFSSATYEIELENGTKVTQETRAASPCIVQVYNADFIDANLKFNTIDSKIKAITFDLGEETKPIRDKISSLNNQIINYDIIIGKTTYYTALYNNFETIFTNRARTIKNDFFNSTIEFTKAHLRRIVDNLSFETYTDCIISNPIDFAKCQALALERDAKPMIDTTRPTLLFESLYESVKKILTYSPHSTIHDDILSNDKEMYEWAYVGLKLHTQGNVKSTCAFCGNPLTTKRIDYLNQLYSDEAAKVKEEAKKIIDQIVEEKCMSQFSSWLALNEYSFSGDYGKQYKTQKNNFNHLASNYKSLLDSLIQILQDKVDNKLFVPVSMPDIDAAPKADLQNWINQMENIIVGHNDNVRNFSQRKNQAIEQYKYHLVASLLREIDYYYVIDGYKKEQLFVNTITEIKESLISRIQELETKVKSIAKGKEICNNYIRLLLHRDDIKIDITEDGYFVLKRAGKAAKNLSEGEKSAIAFAYFLVLLESDMNKLRDSIIVIDDPISSLDANHIAQISSLINSFFFRKNIDPNDPNKVINCFAQLFILTHNFEFFNFVHDANNIKRKKKEIGADGRSIEVPALHEYLIKKVSQSESTIVNLPKSLGTYKSEYVYLWKQICDYKMNGYPEEMNYIMPNLVRRFLEIYTLIKLPGNHDEIDNRVKILISDVNELKILHNFSHFTSLERVVKHSELAMRMPDIIDDVFTLLQKDEVHYKSLNEGIKNG